MEIATHYESHMLKKSEWADARNNRSAGQTDVDGVHISGNPRPTRLDTSIDIAGRRRRPIARDFGLKLARGHGPRRGPGKKNKVGRRLKTVQFESGPEADEGERLDEVPAVTVVVRDIAVTVMPRLRLEREPGRMRPRLARILARIAMDEVTDKIQAEVQVQVDAEVTALVASAH
jgi:hypothetical protein